MPLGAHPLWHSLSRHSFDDPAHAVPFSERLRREQGWSQAFTKRVLEEYRRFLFLTATHSELVVPSEAVDQAWHLHMLDTRAYWDELCARVVERPIHHTPSRGGRAEDVRHADAYDETLRRYRETFGEAPPADIWPCARERFAGRYRRVDTRDVWLIPRRFVTRGAVVAGTLAVLAGCAKAGNSGAVAGFVMVGLVVGMFALLIWAVRQARTREEGSSGGGCGGGVAGCGGGHCGDGGGSGCGGGGGCGGGCG